MADGTRICLIEDDAFTGKVTEQVLIRAGYHVSRFQDGQEALRALPGLDADCVITDLMLPGLDGFEICRQARTEIGADRPKIIVVTGKTYDNDRRRARALGADGYLVKPVSGEDLLSELDRVLSARLSVGYWGVHGTLPVCGKQFLRYGGSTSCVSLTFPDDQLFVFDCGTGIRTLGNRLVAEGRRLNGKIFISHPHWDHINAFPFFAPLFMRGNSFEVLGPAHSGTDMRGLISAQMDSIYFPITMSEMAADITFRDLHEETIRADPAEVRTMLLSHPGNCLGYRVNHGGKSICYVTDNELFPPDRREHNPEYVRRLIAFVAGADLLITDTTYTDAHYPAHVGWGHSCVGQVVQLAHEAGVKALHLFHHDPEDNDDAIDAKLDEAQRDLARLGSSVVASAPAEGQRVEI